MSKTIISLIVLLVIVLAISIGGYLYYSKQILQTKKESIHFHAGFQVYKDGELVDFSGLRYMHEKPCTVDGSESEEHEDEQIEKAHLHDRVGDVVHVHRAAARWSDLFTNLKYSIDPKKTESYLNGKKVDNVQDMQIKPYDSLALFIGEHGDIKSYLSKAVTKSHIQEVEKRSENCGT